MIKENGIVTKANPSVAWVKTIRSAACESCASKKSCGTPGNLEEMIVSVKNTINVVKGDHVVVGLESRPMLFLTFFLYVFPIISLTLGAIIGDAVAPSFQKDPSLISMVMGFLFFGLSFLIIRMKNNSLSKKKKFKPFLVRKRFSTAPVCSSS